MVRSQLHLWGAIVCLSAALATSVGPGAGELLRVQRAVRWLGDAAVAADATEVRLSPGCGNSAGVFAVRALVPGERLATVPLVQCLSSADACADVAIGPACRAFLAGARGDPTAEGVALAALLVLARTQPSGLHAPQGKGGGSSGGEMLAEGSSDARERWGPYVDSLPWGGSVEAGAAGEIEAFEDPLQAHALVAADAKDCADVVRQRHPHWLQQ